MGKTFEEVYGTWKGFCKKTTIKLAKQGYFNNNKEMKSFHKFMLSRDYLGNHRFVDDLTWLKCWELTKEIKRDDDNIIAVVGNTGTGKSHTAKIIAGILTPSFSAENILYTPEKLPHFLKTMKRGETLLFDEGALFVHSADHASTKAKQITKLLTMMRVAGLNVIICIPNFFLLSKYMREERVKVLVHVNSRGKFNVYKKDAINRISVEAPKRSNKIEMVAIPYELFYKGRCGKHIPQTINEKEYDSRKKESFLEFVDELETNISKDLEKDNPDNINLKDAADYLNVSIPSVRRFLSEGKMEKKKVGREVFIPRDSLEKYYKERNHIPLNETKEKDIEKEEPEKEVIEEPPIPINGYNKKNKYGTVFG